MKNVTKRHSVFLATVIGLMSLSFVLGCQHRGGELPDEARTVQILSTISNEKLSKGIVVQNTALTSVRFLQTNGTIPTSLAGATPFLGTRSADGSIAWQSTAPTYNRAGLKAHFVAYYPQGTETTNTKTDWVINGKSDLLLSAPWDAGTYLSPKTGTGAGETPLTFNHALARIRICFRAQAGADLSDVRAQYGKITGVKFAQSFGIATYTYATNKVTFSGTKTDMVLLQPNCETAFTAIDIPASNNTLINAAGIFAPTTGAFTLLIAIENHPEIPVVLQLTNAAGNVEVDFEAGKIYQVTLTFKIEYAQIVVSGCSIVDWSSQYTAGSDVAI